MHEDVAESRQLRFIEPANRGQCPLGHGDGLRLIAHRRDRDQVQDIVDAVVGPHNGLAGHIGEHRNRQAAQRLLHGRRHRAQGRLRRQLRTGHGAAERIEHQHLGNPQVPHVVGAEVLGEVLGPPAADELDRLVPVRVVHECGGQSVQLLRQQPPRALAFKVRLPGLQFVKGGEDGMLGDEDRGQAQQADGQAHHHPGLVLKLHGASRIGERRRQVAWPIRCSRAVFALVPAEL
jgi:hypothetical protein